MAAVGDKRKYEVIEISTKMRVLSNNRFLSFEVNLRDVLVDLW